MQSLIRTFSGTLLAIAALAAAAGAQAQSSGYGSSGSTTTTTTSTSGSKYSWYAPGATYLGLNVGKTDYSLNSGVGGFVSDQRDTNYSLYGGGYLNNNFGLELGYTHFGKVARAGGSTDAKGISLSLVGRLPLNSSFNLLGRLGTTYGRTHVSSVPASGIAAGRGSGFGLSYGLGAEYAFNPNWSAVLQWDRYDLKFPGGSRDNINSTTVGLKYRF